LSHSAATEPRGEPVNVLLIQRLSDADRERIAAVDPRVRVIDAGRWFDGEIRDTWPAYTTQRYLPPNSAGNGTCAERDKLLAEADVIVGGFPFPLDLRARSPRLKWFHQRPAGASNLLRGDLWGSDVIVTTSRGVGSTLAMAEYAVAGMLYFAKDLPRAIAGRETGAFDHRAYRPLLIDGKTALVVGAGGIGLEVGRLLGALGLRVVGTRRTLLPGAPLPAGFREMATPGELDRLLPAADFVAICCPWTQETHHLFNRERFARMKPGAVLVNVARGEIVDEDALVEALLADRLRGVVLDVYDGEFERPPPARLWRDPRVLLTPHVSGHTDENRHGAIRLFCDNLRAFLDGRPLKNVIDWQRGY
jgi:phosphoglycerate dehydrogenase-like enzyme